ncbi:hypothetical protein BKA03_002729 [Demequina lutea]|uniref:Uncharacterized protein n=1 Tax=Demequina lutea TaxID=431489 RepID=A0A7Y9ZEQ4_9MICO|nr:hypothetical protein [Demequina lutea]
MSSARRLGDSALSASIPADILMQMASIVLSPKAPSAA